MSMLSSLSGYLGLQEAAILRVASKAPKLYRRYLVDKRTGGKREIFHPAKDTKALQIAAIDLLYSDDLQHKAATGYRRNLKSPLKHNANIHCNNQFLLRLDFLDFFPSITFTDFEAACVPRLKIHGSPLTPADVELLGKIFFIELRARGRFLAIGAPSSPFISNWVVYGLDVAIEDICSDFGCVYSRYADDICLSSPNKAKLIEVENKIQSLVKTTTHPTLRFNSKKRRLSCPWTRRCITGLVITPTGHVKVPRSTKRYVRSLLDRYRNGKLSADDAKMLAGYLSFINDCETEYITNLVMKYGADTIRRASRRS